MNLSFRRALIAAGAAIVLLAAAVAPVTAKPGGGGGGGSHGTGTAFTNFSLASTPPQPAGTNCPGSSAAAESQCWNFASEPMIRASLDGTFYATSENGVTSGTVAWKSTDGGLHYQSLLGPNDASQTQDAGFAPGGGDTDLATGENKLHGHIRVAG